MTCFRENGAGTSRVPTMHARDRSAIALITIVWVGMVVLVNPVGDFPLNDDWAYGWSVKTLLENGQFQLSDWTAVNLLSQVLWGMLFCLPLGFSFTALRLSTLTLGLIGVIASYGVLREVKASPGVSLAGALTVALNPIYFCLANSFMTDVPSFSFTIVSFYFLVRAFNRQSIGNLGAGIVVSLVSILNRQTGVIAIPAFAVAYLMKNGLQLRSVFRALALSLPGLALYLSYPTWLALSGKTPYLYDFQTTLMLNSLSRGISDIAATYAQNLFVMSTYLGLFLLPFLLVARSDLFRPRNITRPRVLAALLLVAAAALWAAKYKCMPSAGNVLDVAGVGPSAISGATGLALEPLTIRRIWQVVTVVGVVGAAILLRALFEPMRAALTNRAEPGVRVLCVFALAMTALYVLAIGALRGWFDRYLIALMPSLMLIIWIGTRVEFTKARAGLGASVGAMIVLYGLFTVTSTHDYLSWNRLRWGALETLLRDSRIPPENVHGGFEFNGWFFGQRLGTCNPTYRKHPFGGSRSWRDFTCLWNDRDTPYRLALVARDGYTVEEQYAFRLWLPHRDLTLYVLRRDAPDK